MSSQGELNSYAISSFLFAIPFLKEVVKTGYGTDSNFDTKFKKRLFVLSIVVCGLLTFSSFMMLIGFYTEPTIGVGIASIKISNNVFAGLFIALVPFPMLSIYY
ncbi:hypothetical protein NRK67_00690 [Fusobacteria bacterium ZRK30]|nr:hypothetical protein NRK67_00690 [Fusobacteria bacterium ZRK30]